MACNPESNFSSPDIASLVSSPGGLCGASRRGTLDLLVCGQRYRHVQNVSTRYFCVVTDALPLGNTCRTNSIAFSRSQEGGSRGGTMLRISVVILAVSIPAFAGPPSTFVDLRAPQALENLKRDNPAHFEKLRQILAGLEEKPERVESDWLQATFNAQDVDLSRMIVKTSYPPK